MILSNFNIFSSKHGIENNNSVTSIDSGEKKKTWDGNVLDADSSSTKSGRRPSVDTVSTYLSHENPVDLLDSSVGSDDAFKDSFIGKSRMIYAFHDINLINFKRIGSRV